MSDVSIAGGEQSAAVLDIGDGAGALVVFTSAGRAGHEIHAIPLTATGTRTHAVVHRRSAAGAGDAYAALFDALLPGGYGISMDQTTFAVEVEVRAGSVSEVTLDEGWVT